MTFTGKTRSFVKGITWRILASGFTFIAGWIITGDLATGSSLAIVDALAKFIIYYLNERVWEHNSNEKS